MVRSGAATFELVQLLGGGPRQCGPALSVVFALRAGGTTDADGVGGREDVVRRKVVKKGFCEET